MRANAPRYFAVFSISLFLWSAQAIYSRAFYAAGNTFAPMVAGTIITVISLPIYAAFFSGYGAMGLAFASDMGIGMQTLTIALLLHQRHMVSLASLDYRELGRCLAAALTGGAVTWIVFSWMAGEMMQRMHLAVQGRLNDLLVLVGGHAALGCDLFVGIDQDGVGAAEGDDEAAAACVNFRKRI